MFVCLVSNIDFLLWMSTILFQRRIGVGFYCKASSCFLSFSLVVTFGQKVIGRSKRSFTGKVMLRLGLPRVCSYTSVLICLVFSWCAFALMVDRYQTVTCFGSFILHLLLGLCWDEVWNCWDRSQLSPSQTPTNHPSRFIWNILYFYTKKKILGTHDINYFKIHPNRIPTTILVLFCYLGIHYICERWWDFVGE